MAVAPGRPARPAADADASAALLAAEESPLPAAAAAAADDAASGWARPPSGSRPMTRQLAKEIAEDTVACCSAGFYEAAGGRRVELPIAAAVEGTRLHAAGGGLPPAPPPRGGVRELRVERASTLQAAEALAAEGLSVCVLNFASAKRPGGGFLNGAMAQEEALARSTGLYPCLLKDDVQAFYSDNRAARSCAYTDHMIMSPAVPVFKRDDGTPLDSPYTVGIVTVPAPNLSAARGGRSELEDLRGARRRRMERMLSLCASGGFGAVVLGAWGCGVFQNDPREVAGEFRRLLEGRLRDAFPRVVFAVIPDEPTCAIFREVLGGPPPLGGGPGGGPPTAGGGGGSRRGDEGARGRKAAARWRKGGREPSYSSS